MFRPLITTVGCCTSTAARICITTRGSLAHARLAFRSGGGALEERTLRLSSPEGSTFLHGTFELEGLAASSRVEYAVAVAAAPEALPSREEIAEAGRMRGFRLLPAPGQPLRIGLVSCNGVHSVSDPARRHAMWKRLAEVVAAGEIDLLLHVGDQIYADHIREEWQRGDWDDALTPEHPELMGRLREAFRALYCDTWQRPEIAEVLGTVPSMMMWDDHDIFDGWGSFDEVTEADRAFFEAARTAFEEFQARLNPPSFSANAYGFGWVSHGIGLLVLDARTHRSWVEQTIIGRTQWAEADAWLEAQVGVGLKRLFVITGVPPLHARVAAASRLLERLGLTSVLSDVRDAWMAPNNTEELRKLLNRLFEFRKRSPGTEVTSLSGDVHVGTTARLRSRVPFHKRNESDQPGAHPGGVQRDWRAAARGLHPQGGGAGHGLRVGGALPGPVHGAAVGDPRQPGGAAAVSPQLRGAGPGRQGRDGVGPQPEPARALLRRGPRAPPGADPAGPLACEILHEGKARQMPCDRVSGRRVEGVTPARPLVQTAPHEFASELHEFHLVSMLAEELLDASHVLPANALRTLLLREGKGEMVLSRYWRTQTKS